MTLRDQLICDLILLVAKLVANNEAAQSVVRTAEVLLHTYCREAKKEQEGGRNA
jgi:hypothetical protein